MVGRRKMEETRNRERDELVGALRQGYMYVQAPPKKMQRKNVRRQHLTKMFINVGGEMEDHWIKLEWILSFSFGLNVGYLGGRRLIQTPDAS